MKPDVIPVTTETLGELLSRRKTPEDFHALTKTLFKQVAKRALQAEMAHHRCIPQHNITEAPKYGDGSVGYALKL